MLITTRMALGLLGAAVASHLLFCMFAAVDLHAAEFLLPEQLPGYITPRLSADGLTVTVGNYNDGDPQLIRWSVASGVGETINVSDYFPAATHIGLRNIAADGSSIVGSLLFPGYRRAFRWTETGGIESLDPQGQYANSYAEGVSADGSVVVGWGDDGMGSSRTSLTSLVWNNSTSPTALGGLDGFEWSEARDVSSNGQVIVGQSKTVTNQEDRRVGWVWTAQDGFVATDSPLGVNATHTTRVSGDGTVAVGWGPLEGSFRWTEAGGYELLGSSASVSDDHSPRVVSHDGSVILGPYSKRNGAEGSYVWDEHNEMRDLESVLRDEHGVTLPVPNYENFLAYGISDNLQTLVGSLRERGQTEYRTWIVNLDRPLVDTVPEPSSVALLLAAILSIVARLRSPVTSRA